MTDSTDNAPKRLWAAPWKPGEWSEGDWDTHEGKLLNDKPAVLYIRADLATDPQGALVTAMCDAVRQGDIIAACDALDKFDAALAAFDKGGKTDG